MPKANNRVVGHCACHGCDAKVEIRESLASGNFYYTCDGRADPTNYCNSMMKFGRKPTAKLKELLDGYTDIQSGGTDTGAAATTATATGANASGFTATLDTGT